MKDLSLHILDIVENSVRAGAKNIGISIVEDTDKDLLRIKIEDDGKGMDKEMAVKASNPFITTKANKKVGLGISLLKQAAETANGRFKLESELNKGTKVEAEFQLSNIDRKPLGDIAESLISAILMAKDTEFDFEYKKDKETFSFNTKEIKSQLNIDKFTDVTILKEIKILLKNKLKEIQEY